MKRGFVGQATPIGYDYKTLMGPDVGRGTIPNPILENVLGMLICYDEIWFISRDFCPVDMHDLPYIKFISDYPERLNRAIVAREQFSVKFNDPDSELLPVPDADDLWSSHRVITESAPFDLYLDNHNRYDRGFKGNGADGRLFFQDIGIADSLDLTVDIVTNTPLSNAISRIGAKPFALQNYENYKLAATEELLELRTMDLRSPRGAYHESVEELRAHSRVQEFRQMLTSTEVPDRDAESLAKTINYLAMEYSRDAMDRYLSGRGVVQTVSNAAISVVGNSVYPGAGTVASSSLNALNWIRQRSERKKVGWSLFVLDRRLKA